MGKFMNLIAGAGAGYMQGARMKEDRAHAKKMDEVYGQIAAKMAGEKSATTPPTVTPPVGAPVPSNATPVVATDNTAPMGKTPAEANTGLIDERANGGMIGYANGGLVAPNAYCSRMGWQRQNFKK